MSNRYPDFVFCYQHSYCFAVECKWRERLTANIEKDLFSTENQTFLRKATALHQCRVKEDEAWKKTINAMMDLLPSDELTALYTQLKGFELYPS